MLGSASLMTQPSDDHVGRIIAERYRVDACIGSGGLARVYRSWDLQLKRPVALKLLRRDSDETSDTRDRRLLKEARLAGCLNSPHVVQVFDSGRSDLAEPFIVMELLSGHDLTQAPRPLPEEPAAEAWQRMAVGWLLQALLGLAAAHAAGIVHRDLKPSNLFLVDPDGAAPRIKLLDFGVSKQAWGSAELLPEESTLTRSGSYLGTPVYASPEQLRDARLADTRSDLWSLGVVLYELLSGARPFDRASLPAVGAAIVGEEPQAPDGVPPALAAVVMRCLEKDPARRYSSAAELAHALAPFADNGAIWAQQVADTLAQRAPASTISEPPAQIATETWVSKSEPARPQRASRLPVVAALALLTLTASGIAVWYRSQGQASAVPPPLQPLEHAPVVEQHPPPPRDSSPVEPNQAERSNPPPAERPVLRPLRQASPKPVPASAPSEPAQPRSVLDER